MPHLPYSRSPLSALHAEVVVLFTKVRTFGRPKSGTGTAKVLPSKELTESPEVDFISFNRLPAFPLGCAELKMIID